jgi:hypothetical protein
MRVDISGSWIYVYSGKSEDRYSQVDAFHLASITRVTVNQKEATFTFYLGGDSIHVKFEGTVAEIVQEFLSTLDRLSLALKVWNCDPHYLTHMRGLAVNQTSP